MTNSNFEAERVHDEQHLDCEEVNQDERDRLLYELVVRQSAMEKALIKSNLITEKDLAEAQVECMEKLKEVIDKRNSSSQSFIKYGEDSSKS